MKLVEALSYSTAALSDLRNWEAVCFAASTHDDRKRGSNEKPSLDHTKLSTLSSSFD